MQWNFALLEVLDYLAGKNKVLSVTNYVALTVWMWAVTFTGPVYSWIRMFL